MHVNFSNHVLFFVCLICLKNDSSHFLKTICIYFPYLFLCVTVLYKKDFYVVNRVWQEWIIENNTFVAMVLAEGDKCGNKQRSTKVLFIRTLA